MPSRYAIAFMAGILSLAGIGAKAQTAADPSNELVITFNDGHEQRIPVGDLGRVEFRGTTMIFSQDGRPQHIPVSEIAHMEFTNVAVSNFGRARYSGKWRVGDGHGNDFYITLERNGEAHRSMNSNYGTWVVVNGEARITWDDGWRDVIRKVGGRYQKVAYEPGRSFDEGPSNVARAENINPEPI